MAIITDTEENPEFLHQGVNTLFEKSSKTLEEPPWIEFAAQQAQIYQKILEETLDSTIEVTRSRILEIRATSSAHLNQTLDSLQDIKLTFKDYENVFLEKVREGVHIAASNPAITCGAAAGLGVLVLKSMSFLESFAPLNCVIIIKALVIS
ncbi:hypothetical protein GIB67_001198 [Kingdonia uniflora]|uniref:Uncharacterized protein n=1 Tax=Kingdonia uniflora TaxID=39325 RepID=A0A7J7LG66_9MAGN|nr:hypothetical protein GIB67_001198 [Kingdonia uniflora]